MAKRDYEYGTKCKACSKYVTCQLQPSKDCFVSTKTTPMEDKIRQRKALAKFRKKVAKG